MADADRQAPPPPYQDLGAAGLGAGQGAAVLGAAGAAGGDAELNNLLAGIFQQQTQTMAQLTQAMADTRRANAEAIRGLADQLHHARRQGDGHARVEPLPKINANTFAPLAMDNQEIKNMEEFYAWESSVRNTVVAIDAERPDFPFQRLAAGILGSLTGTARRSAQSFNPQLYPNLNDFFNGLKQLLLGAAVQEKARAMYEKRRQKTKEDINTYHSDLRNLFMQAFPGQMEQQGGEANLIHHFLKFLSNQELRQEIWLRHNTPNTYEGARVLALQCIGRIEAFQQLEQDYKGSGDRPTNRPPIRTPHDLATPMEISNVNRRGRRINAVDQQVNDQSPSARKKCTICNKVAYHTPDRCWERNKKSGEKRNINAVEEDTERIQEDESEDDWDPPKGNMVGNVTEETYETEESKNL